MYKLTPTMLFMSILTANDAEFYIYKAIFLISASEYMFIYLSVCAYSKF